MLVNITVYLINGLCIPLTDIATEGLSLSDFSFKYSTIIAENKNIILSSSDKTHIVPVDKIVSVEIKEQV